MALTREQLGNGLDILTARFLFFDPGTRARANMFEKLKHVEPQKFFRAINSLMQRSNIFPVYADEVVAETLKEDAPPMPTPAETVPAPDIAAQIAETSRAHMAESLRQSIDKIKASKGFRVGE